MICSIGYQPAARLAVFWFHHSNKLPVEHVF